jgi:tetratricopeptide (TPR) repeat protein
VTGTVIYLHSHGSDPPPAALVRGARGALSREAFATALTAVLGWPVKPGMVRAWESGVMVPPSVVEACRAGVGGSVFEAAATAVAQVEPQSSPVPGAATLGVIDPSLADFRDLAAWITATNTTDEAIGHIERVASALAEMTAQVPDRQVLADVMQLHYSAQQLLRGGRQRLRQTRELVRLDGNVLAHASVLLSNLGKNRAAEDYGQTALLYLQEAGASQATAWYALAKIARWEHRYTAAADLSRQGPGHNAVTPMNVQLASYEANAAALIGDQDRARQALARAESIAKRLPPGDGELSPWSFPPARQAIFRLSVLLRTGDPGGALLTAEKAEGNSARVDKQNAWTWAQIRIGAAIAHLGQGSLDGAAEQVAPALALPPEMRITTVTGWLADLDRALARPRFASSQITVSLRQQIREFMAGALREAG